jgi:methylenetetrahydrofolate dehydrogenase (NADP+) / methenyltetrahydrofolate cyclohydrolase
MQIIDGKKLAKRINDLTVKEVLELGHRPNLAIILVGENPDSALYVKKKIETAKKVGIDIHLYKCDTETGQQKILEMIEFLNTDPDVDAIMVQLPLPKDQGYDTDEIIERIRPNKDLDRFHPDNIESMLDHLDEKTILPPVFAVIMEMLKSIGAGPKGKKVSILSKSEIFGGNLAKVFALLEADSSVTHPDDPERIKEISEADILVSVIGRPKFVKKEMIKEGAVVIDVGITRELGSVYGDVDFEDVKDKAGYISPVPGGVGPMTVALTLRNVLLLHKRYHTID